LRSSPGKGLRNVACFCLREAVRFLLVGALLTFIAPARGLTRRLALTSAMICLVVGAVIGPGATGVMKLDLTRDTGLVRTLAEV
jgi:hypothetical protein